MAPIRIGARRRPRALLGDKAYSTTAIRAWARAPHVRLVVPERADQLAWRRRNVIERAVGWLKRGRRVATRAEKLAVTFRAAICLVLAARYATRNFSDAT